MLEDVSPDVISTHHPSLQCKWTELKEKSPSTFTSVKHVATMNKQ
jgi:hypothetical protein